MLKIVSDDQSNLKDILYPSFCETDDSFIEEHLDRFIDGTRETIFDSFEKWISDENSSDDDDDDDDDKNNSVGGDDEKKDDDGGGENQNEDDDNSNANDEEGQSKKLSRVLILTAPSGYGKTCVACKLSCKFNNIVVAYHFVHQGDERRCNPKLMLMSIAYQLSESIPSYRAELELMVDKGILTTDRVDHYGTVDVFNVLLKIPLGKITLEQEKKKYVLLIDGLDECKQRGGKDIVSCIQNYFGALPNWILTFVTTHSDDTIDEKLKHLNPRTIEPEREDNLNDIRMHFQRSLKAHDRKFPPTFNFNNAIENLSKKSGGNFLFASHLSEMFRSSAEATEDTVDELPGELKKYYEQQFETMCITTDHTCMEWLIIQIIVASIEPPSLELIKAFAKCSDDNCREVLTKLSNFLRFDDTFSEVSPYHKCFTDWLTMQTGRFSNSYFLDTKEAEKNIATRCYVILSTSKVIGTSEAIVDEPDVHKDVMQYIYRYSITHMSSSQMYGYSKKLITDVSWVLKKTETGDSRSFVLDCQKVVDKRDDKVVELIGRAVELSSDVLRVDPKQLPSQLIGRLHGSSDTKDENVGQEISGFIERLREYDYGFKWWSPISAAFEQANEPCLRQYVGHKSHVHSVHFSPDDSSIVSGSRNGAIKIWNTKSGRVEGVLQGHSKAVNAVSFSPDGTMIASASSDKSIRLWNYASNACERVLEEHIFSVTDVKFSPDSAKFDHEILGDSTKKLLSSGSPDDIKLASTALDKSVRVWDVMSGHCEHSFRGHREQTTFVEWSNDGSKVLSGSEDDTVRVWIDASLKEQCEAILDGPKAKKLFGKSREATAISLVSATWSLDDTKVMVLYADGTIKKWTTKKWRFKEKNILNKSTTEDIRCACWSNDKTRLVVGLLYPNNNIMIFNTSSGECENIFEGHTSSVSSFAWSTDDRRIISGSYDNSIRLWDATQSTGLQQKGKKKGRAASSSTVGGNIKSNINGNGDHADLIMSFVWSPDGSTVASGSRDKTVRLWCATTGECKHVLKGHTKYVDSIAWSDYGKLLASGSSYSGDKTVRLWDVNSGKCKQVVKSTNGKITHQKFPQYQTYKDNNDIKEEDLSGYVTDGDIVGIDSKRTKRLGYDNDIERVCCVIGRRYLRFFELISQTERQIIV